MASVLEIIINARDDASGVLGSVLSGVQDLGGGVARVGTGMMAVAAPFVAGLGVAANAAMGYNEILTNIQSVTGDTAAETALLGQEILDMSANSRFSGDEAANAFYDIAGGVTDVEARMSILQASMSLAQAGATDLGGATSAMISIMNSYGFAAEQAGFASDVLTRTVGMGVGTMGDFASALPQVTGLANSMGIAFEDVAAGAAFLTTQGNSASQAATQMGAMMTTLLSPTAALSDIISGLGYESGQAMVDALGLAGAYSAIRQAGGGSFAGIITNTEALRGATALTNEAFTEFSDNFISGIDGATAAAEEIQMASPAAQMDMLRSSLGALSIEVGSALLPAINDIVQGVRPLIIGFTQWLRANPQVVSTVIAVVGAVAGLGAALVGVGGFISGVGGAIAALANPVTWIVGAIGLLATAFATNFMGIRDVVEPIITNITTGFTWLLESIGWFIDDIQNFGIMEAINMAFGGGAAGGESWVEGVIAGFLGAGGQASGAMRELAQNITTALGDAVSFVTTTVIPGLQSLVSWFITDGLPLAVNFVQTIVIPAVQGFITTLGNIWAVVGPALFSLVDWFINTGLPTAVNFVQTVVVPAVETFIATLVRVWNDVSPFLVSLFDWFVNTGLPLITSFIQETVIPAVEDFISFLSDLWLAVQPHLESLYNWFVVEALPAIQEFIEGPVTTAIEGITSLISGIWEAVRPALESFYNFFIDNIGTIVDIVITPLKNAFDDVMNIGGDVMDFIGDAAAAIGDFVGGIFGGGQPAGGSQQEWDNYYAAQNNQLPPISGFFGRDSGGFGAAGQAYMIGTGAQPEMFIPSTNGTFLTPQQYAGAGAGAGGGMTINGLTINANSYAEGQAAAEGFNARMTAFEEERRRRG